MILWMSIVCMVWAEEPSKDQVDIVLESGDISTVPVEVQEAQAASWSEPLGVRMKLITESLLGKPYLLNGIGEMQVPDPDPLVRYDAFDCLTFVEEAISFARNNANCQPRFARIFDMEMVPFPMKTEITLWSLSGFQMQLTKAI